LHAPNLHSFPTRRSSDLEMDMPRIIVVNRMDRDRADKERVLESLRAAFGRQVVPVFLPIGSERNLTGVVDLVTMKSYTYTMGGRSEEHTSELQSLRHLVC